MAEHTQAVLDYTEKLTRSPHTLTQTHVQHLRQHGYSDEDIHDIVQIGAFFNYINRVADALGVPPEDFMDAWDREDGQWPQT